MKLEQVLRGKRVAIYGRHSTDKQEMDAQIASAEKLVQDYECKVVGRYFDRGVSATKKPQAKRGELVRLMKDAVEGKFDAVITYNRDRIARNPIEHQKIRVLMQSFEIPIVLSSTETLYDTGDLISQLAFDGLTKFEVDQTRIRTRDTLRNFVRNGKWTGGKPPYGYEYNERTATFHQRSECTNTIQNIFELYRRGEGFKNIAEILNQDETEPRSWTNFDVKSVITNPFYAGYITFGKGIARSHASIAAREFWLMTKCPAIPPTISDELWEACWKIYWDKRQGETSPTDLTTVFVLKDLIYCETCKQPLQPVNQISRGADGKEYGHRWYRCPHFKDCHTRVLVDDANNAVFDTMNRIVLSKVDVFSEVSSRLKQNEQMYTRQIEEMEAAIKENERLSFEALQTMKQMTREEAKDDRRNVVLAQIQKYRLDLEAHNQNIKCKISGATATLRHIQTVQLQPNLWEDIRKDVLEPKKSLTEPSRRRLALYLLDRVWVTQQGDISLIKTKANLD